MQRVEFEIVEIERGKWVVYFGGNRLPQPAGRDKQIAKLLRRYFVGVKRLWISKEINDD